jgi:predicted nucleotidyltransferase
VKLDAAFSTFIDKIALRALSEQRIGSAWGRLHQFLTAAYDLPATHVFIQGSYANKTAIRPCDGDGEYDVDIVVVFVPLGMSAEEAIEDLRAKLEVDGDLSKRLEKDEPGRPCVRLRYADDPEGFGFHIDVVPARPLEPFPPSVFDYPKTSPPQDVPMRGREKWRGTAPLEYTQFCLDRGERVRTTVRELKRWRDVHEAQIKSIVLQVLVADHHPAGR